MIKAPGKQATRSQQILLSPWITDRCCFKSVDVIHHVTEDTPHKLQLEVEQRCPLHGITFKRITL